MSVNTYYLQYSICGGKDKHYPTSPVVNICLKGWMSNEEKGDKGPPIISPDLMTEDEIDLHVKKLKSELETIRIEAKEALRARLSN